MVDLFTIKQKAHNLFWGVCHLCNVSMLPKVTADVAMWDVYKHVRDVHSFYRPLPDNNEAA